MNLVGLHRAIRMLDLASVQDILGHYPDAHSRQRAARSEAHGQPALLQAIEVAWQNWTEPDQQDLCWRIVQTLLDAGALPANNPGWLCHLARCQIPASTLARETMIDGVLRLLVQHGAQVNGHMPGVGTPLYAAVKAGHLPLTQALLRVGALPDWRTRAGRLPEEALNDRDASYTPSADALTVQKMLQAARRQRELQHQPAAAATRRRPRA